ncbi:MAG: hypothetical protein ACRD19_16905 [Terriglobia bacterium]
MPGWHRSRYGCGDCPAPCEQICGYSSGRRELTDRQNQMLQALAGGKELQLANFRTPVAPAVADSTLRDDLLDF